ncbi:FYDLN acid domain-containing protein [bacterium]|nr:FYDLN acid domain-containing protein [candidate division CSSED10-310 bacterium]
MDRLQKLGKRLICDDCSTKYYDMNRTPNKCPKCGSSKIRKKMLKTAAIPVNIDIDEEDIKDVEIDLEPLDDLDLGSDDDDTDDTEEPDLHMATIDHSGLGDDSGDDL